MAWTLSGNLQGPPGTDGTSGTDGQNAFTLTVQDFTAPPIGETVTVGVQSVGPPAHLFVSTMAAHVGLDPRKDIRWVAEASPKPMELFAAGQIDAFLGFPPEPQDLRGRGIGRVIVNSVIDRPWSQYFCCMVATHGRAKDCSTSSSYPMMEDAMRRRRLEKRTLIRSLPIAIL